MQINGKRRGEIRAPAGADAQVVEQLVRRTPPSSATSKGMTVRRVVVVPDRIVNLVAA